MEPVTGYLYTHWDCPECGEENYDEGDASGDIVQCQFCQRKFEVDGVR